MTTVNGSVANSGYLGGWRARLDIENTVNNHTTFAVEVYWIDVIAVRNSSGVSLNDYAGSKQTITVSASNQSTATQTVAGQWNMDLGTYSWFFNKVMSWTKTHSPQQKTITASARLRDWGIWDPYGNSKTISDATSTISYTITVPALESWTVTLDAQGGTGAASTLTKYYGEALALPQPVKNGYEFSHWTDDTTNYTTSYTANAAASLVAVWTPVITSATITQLYAARDDGRFLWDIQTGKHTSASDDGEYVYIRAWWRVDGADAATISLGATMADTSTVWTGATRQVSKPGTGELYVEGVAEWGTTQTALVTGQYDVTVTLSTGAGNPSDSRGTTVSTAFFTIDVLAGGHGIAFGKPATRQLFDVGMETNFDHDVRVMGTPLVPIGTILDFAGENAPTGYLVCNGSAVPRSDYAALFAVIGTKWGAGDGSTTFNVPDLRGRTAIGAGTGTASDATAHALGSKGGTETHTLTAAQIALHNHPLPNSAIVYNADGTQRLATSGSGTLSSINTNVGLSTGQQTSGGGAHPNMQPYATVTKIIRAI